MHTCFPQIHLCDFNVTKLASPPFHFNYFRSVCSFPYFGIDQKHNTSEKFNHVLQHWPKVKDLKSIKTNVNIIENQYIYIYIYIYIYTHK